MEKQFLTKLDWYIIKKYISTFIFTVAMITLIAIAIDFFEKVDKFLDADTTFGHIMKDYYLNFIPWINGLLWPLFALIAVIFFTSRMARDSEIIAILAAGISYNRFLRPYFIAGTFLAILLWIGNNYVIPRSNEIKNEFEGEYIRRGEKTTLSTDQHFFISPNEKAYFRMFNIQDSTVYNFRLETFEGGRLTKMLKAEKLVFMRDTGTWRMFNFEERLIGLDTQNLEIFDPKLISIKAYPFTPSDFVRYSKQMEMLTTSDLRAFMQSEREKGLETAKKYLIELYRRTADPFTIIILTIIGVSVGSRKVRGGLGFHLSFGIITGAIFVIISKFTVTFATNLSLPAILGVWLPNIIFSCIAYYLYLKAQK